MGNEHFKSCHGVEKFIGFLAKTITNLSNYVDGIVQSSWKENLINVERTNNECMLCTPPGKSRVECHVIQLAKETSSRFVFFYDHL